MRFTIEELEKQGLLRKIPPSRQKADESMKAAKLWLSESEKNFKSQSFMSCVSSSYLSMFHAARSILFFDGFREKSHFAVARYLEEAYSKKGKLESMWISLIDNYREERHSGQYGTEVFIDEKQAKTSLSSTKKFVSRIEALLLSKTIL